MIPLRKEKRILTLLNIGGISARKIALRVGVARETVKAVRDNRKSRALSRAAETRKLAVSSSVEFKKKWKDGWEHKLKLERLLGQEGERFVYIVRDIINLDSMRVIHHPLFASLVKQSREAMKLLPISQERDYNE